MKPNTDHEPYRREVERLHAFFEAWFNGTVADDEASFADFSHALDPDFTIISPDGVRTEREALEASLRRAYGCWASPEGPGEIRIEGTRVEHSLGESALIGYEEWQRREGRWRGRRSSALLRRDTEAPHGWLWCHVHEVWIDADRP